VRNIFPTNHTSAPLATVPSGFVDIGTTRVDVNEILSVRKRSSPVRGVGCAIAPIILGAMSLAAAFASVDGERIGMLVIAAVLLLVGVAWWKSLEIWYYVEVQTRTGTVRSATELDEDNIDSAIAMIHEARAPSTNTTPPA
jgi:hypothetical protein